MTGAAGTLGAGPAERPIYLSFTPNFSAVRMGPKPSSGHRLGLGYRTAENLGTETDVRLLPDCVRCTSESRHSSPDGEGPLLTRSGLTPLSHKLGLSGQTERERVR